jgi:hypothetical protein
MNDRLYGLLPAYIRQADDALLGKPLHALLAVVEEQVDLVHADIAQLYDNWFIETCADWVVPYIGDLVGYEPPIAADLEAPIPRSDVADVIRTRRRKGTLSVLETIARDITGWPAVAIEFERAIAATFSPLTVPGVRERTLDLRDAGVLAKLRDPRSLAAHGVAVGGTYAPRSVGLIVSRLRAYAVSRSDAACVGTQGEHCYTFDALGFDIPLFSALQPLPALLTAHDLEREYGLRKSLALWTRPAGRGTHLEPVLAERIVGADLTHWRFRPKPGDVAVDVARGRISFAPGHAPEGVVVRYFYGARAAIGAGEYPRDLTPIAERFPIAHSGREEHHHLRAALGKWKSAEAAQAFAPETKLVRKAAIEFGDSHVYDEADVRIELAADDYLEIRAEDGTRPIVRIEDRSAGRLDALRIRGGPRSTLVLDGLVIARRGIEISGDIAHVIIRRCTLVPDDCPISLLSPTVQLTIEQSIIGDIRTIEDETRQEPTIVSINDSIVGAHRREDAVGAPDKPVAFIDLRVARSTIFGRVRVHGVSLIENAIFTRPLTVRRRAAGCVRFSYLAPQSAAPPGFACRSEPAPLFMSREFTDPQYGQLAPECSPAIRAGAENRGEMGAFFTSQNGRKAANLAARVAEFVPPDVDVTIRYLGEG